MSELVSWRALATPHASCLPPETGASVRGTNWTNLDFAGALALWGIRRGLGSFGAESVSLVCYPHGSTGLASQVCGW